MKISPSSIPIRRKVRYALVAALGALVLIELAARLLARSQGDVRWDQHSTTIKVLGFPQLNRILEPDEVLFWRVKPGLDQLSLTGTIGSSALLSFTVSTDKRGRRRVPHRAEYRSTILFLGDSCIFGVGVNDHETVPAVVQDELRMVRSLNAGVPGYTAFQGRRMLKHGRVEPAEAVVITFGHNDDARWDDLGDLGHSLRSKGIGGLIFQHSAFARLTRAALARKESPPIMPPPDSARPRLTDKEFDSEICAIIGWCRRTGAEPILVVWPAADQMDGSLPTGKQEVLQSIGIRKGVALVDLRHLFRQHGGRLNFADCVHANRRGCQLAGREIARALSQKLAPARR